MKEKLDEIMEGNTRGDPEVILKRSSKSTRKIEKKLMGEGFKISHTTIGKELKKQGYSLQGNRKVNEGKSHPDRDKQFKNIAEKTKVFQDKGVAIISVDTKKKENIGNFYNNGREWHQKGKAPQVNTYDFIDKEKGKVSPYGIYDIQKNTGWVNVGISKDTSEFAVNGIRSWWHNLGKKEYIGAKEIYINADGGGSNGSRVRLWKLELSKFAKETGLTIHVSHFPPGTSKWNKIEHRMFCFISKNWRGKPLIDRMTVLKLIENTTTEKGLSIKAVLDEREYKTGIKVSDDEFNSIHIERDEFHGDWNYSIFPQ